MNKALLLRNTATALMLSTAIASVQAADSNETQRMVGGEDRVEQSGPTGMPATTGSGGSADTKGTVTDSGMEMGIGVETFFAKASAQNLAAIEAAQVALEQGSPTVQEYAKTVLENRKGANRLLADMASDMDAEIADDPELAAQAEKWLLELRDDEEFDQAYLDQQIVAQQQSLELHRRAAQIENDAVVGYAEQTLPELQQQLEQAQALSEETKAKLR